MEVALLLFYRGEQANIEVIHHVSGFGWVNKDCVWGQ